MPLGTPSLAASAIIYTSVTLTTTWSGGTSPFTINLYRSTLSGFTPSPATLIHTQSNVVSGFAYVDGTGERDTTYFYVATVTDSAGTPVTTTSNAISVILLFLQAVILAASGDTIKQSTRGDNLAKSSGVG